MRRPWRIAAVLLFAATIAVGAFFGDQLLALNDSARQNLRQYTELVEIAHARYGTKVTYRDVVNSSVTGMLRTLDPHTNFLPPEAYQRMRDRQQGSFFGLGILVGTRNDQLTVIAPLAGTPASRMGIRAGDIIFQIDGEPTEPLSLDDAVQKLKGPKDTEVTITIVRPGLDEPLEITIIRAEIPLTTVRYTYMIDSATGYFRITEFSRSTGEEVEQAISQLREQGMQRLVVDLRDNGGGLLDQAIEVADQFVPSQSKIVETRGRIRDSFQEYEAEGRHDPLDLPLVVLVNGGSASASEILAGAIQDHDVGVIVGSPTWGKGLVQTVYGLSYGAAIALTTAKYYTPSGRLIQRDYTSVYDYYAHSENLDESGLPGAPPNGAPVYHTDLGREVYGGGGITPDVLSEPAEAHELLQLLAARNAFFRFGIDYANRHPIKSESWTPGPDVLTEFKRWLREEDLGDEAQIDEAFADQVSREQTLNRIQAEIFNSTFGNDAWYRVIASADNQIQDALDAFDRADQLLAQRRGLDDGSRLVWQDPETGPAAVPGHAEAEPVEQ
ncbi:MAG: S41 family peptidase [Thermoanaerobaculia bacterium]|nr:S41 family peptidase [Thermoanaerobaculia bacterium]